MQRIAILIEYDGTGYNGWQLQPNGNTIQESVQTVLSRVFAVPITIHGSGRTDTGVHAIGQVAHFDLPADALPVPIANIPLASNSLLMPDIRIRQAALVKSDFHCRFQAIRREYRYYISKHETVFGQRYSWFVRHAFDVDVMREVGKLIIGKRDFTVLSKFNATTESYVCNLTQCTVDETEFGICITIISNRFVYSMCRAIVGAMVAVAQNRVSIAEFAELLNAGERTERLPLAPYHALFLQGVTYHSDIFVDESATLPPFI
ncbi:MAG: tRNA pseudouridine(38-40) synthase TruA [Ignavibacteria bacterium]|nr:tRNA pseudouridine(38-40) synthase TruA [Ignavibacteria bacterium]